MSFFKTAARILSDPSGFTSHLKKEKGIQKAFLYYLAFTLIALPFSFMLLVSRLAPVEAPHHLFNSPVIFSLSFFISLAGVFILAGICHLLLILVKGKGTFEKTFQALIYSKTPSLILAPLQSIYYLAFGLGFMTLLSSFLIAILVFLYQVYLSLLFFSAVHKITKMRAFFGAYIIPLLAILAFPLLMGAFGLLVILFSKAF